MFDLDEMLLEAEGRTGRNQHSPPPSRRRRKGSYSDDGSDSRDDDSDDDRGYGSRKPSGSQVPLKKRLDPAERDDEHSSSREDDEGDEDGHRYEREGDSDNDSVGSDLYKGDEDRERLAKMTELEREMILEDRAIKKQKEKSTQSREEDENEEEDEYQPEPGTEEHAQYYQQHQQLPKFADDTPPYIMQLSNQMQGLRARVDARFDYLNERLDWHGVPRQQEGGADGRRVRGRGQGGGASGSGQGGASGSGQGGASGSGHGRTRRRQR